MYVDTFDDEPAGQRQIETKEKQDNLPRKNLHETAGHKMYVRTVYPIPMLLYTYIIIVWRRKSLRILFTFKK